MRLPHAVLISAAIVIVALGCERREDAAAVRDTADTSAAARACPANKQPFSFRGSLSGKREEVQSALGRGTGDRLWKRGDKAAPKVDGERRYTLIPTCKNHEFTTGELVDGRFVALLRIENDPDNRFSTAGASDTVAWWIYGVTQDDGTIRLVSQFASLTASSDDAFLLEWDFIQCDDSEPWKTEEAGWHGSSCNHGTRATARPLDGDNPWFGCTRGCCYSVGPGRPPETADDTLPSDTLRPDRPRDTTRTRAGA